MFIARLLVLSLLLASGCGSTPQTCTTCAADAGSDAGLADGGQVDAGQVDAGQPDAGVTLPAVVLNELASLDRDFIEVFNRSNQAFDLSGYALAHRGPDGGPQLSDSVRLTGVILNAGQYLVASDSLDAGTVTFSFNISNGSGDTLFLLSTADGGIVDQVTFPPDGHNAGESWGRLPDATGAFRRLTARTPGAANR